MQFIDDAIVISSQKYGESSAIVTMLTHSHGLYKGLVRNISGKKNCGIYLAGNLVEVKWSARLSEHLGNFSAQIIDANAAMLLNDRIKLAALTSMCSILSEVLYEREEVTSVYDGLKYFIQNLKSDDNWPINYIKLEIDLLANIGFGLDLSECAATGVRDNLVYISPKSGRAVCEVAGLPYKNKLFTIPSFMQNQVGSNSMIDVINGLKISGYFLEKYVFTPHNKNLPSARMRYADLFFCQTSNLTVLPA